MRHQVHMHTRSLLKSLLTLQSVCQHLTYRTQSFMILSIHHLFLLACVPQEDKNVVCLIHHHIIIV